MIGRGERLAGKVAVVTGASTGLGRAIAALYAQEGAKVVLADVLADEGAEAVRLIEQEGGEASFVATDVSDSRQVAKLIQEAESRYGALHVLTANAAILGSAYSKSFVDIEDHEFARVMDVNFDGVRLCFKHAIPALRRAGGGALTATTSLAAHRGYGRLAAYSASKGAVLALIRALAVELAPDIRVNTVSPGTMPTDMASNALKAGAPSGQLRAPVPATHSLRTVADPREVAAAHLFLVSDESSFVNGQVLIADGGRSIVSA